MAEDNVEIVRGLYEAFARRDNESPFEVFDPEIEWDISGMEGVSAMGFAGAYHGHDGVRRFWRQWLEAWRAIEFDVLELVEMGECVLATIRQTNVGHGSGIEVEQGTWWQVWTLRDGKVVKSASLTDRDEARRAAGFAD